MPDPFGDRHEISAEEWLAVVGRNDAPSTVAPASPREEREPPKAIELFDDFLTHGGFGRVEREYRFHPTRRWRFDWALPERMIAFEYDGLMKAGENQGHTSIGAVLRDVEKINEAQALGWDVYRVNAKSIHDGSAFSFLDSVLRRIDQ